MGCPLGPVSTSIIWLIISARVPGRHCGGGWHLAESNPALTAPASRSNLETEVQSNQLIGHANKESQLFHIPTSGLLTL
jgi:hypothetical protein